MTSEKQLEANRANAQKSTGPKTEEGKKRSAFNAMRHGLTAQVRVVPEDEFAAYREFTGKYMAALKPEGMLEEQQAIVHTHSLWQVHKIHTMMDNLGTLSNMEGVGDNLGIAD